MQSNSQILRTLLTLSGVLSLASCSDGAGNDDPPGMNSNPGAPNGTGGSNPSDPSASSGGAQSGSGGTQSGSGGVGNGAGGTATMETFDCSSLPEPPEPVVLDHITAERGIAFDNDGMMITGSLGLFRSSRTSSAVFAPSFDAGFGQIRRMANGDFLIAQGVGKGLVRVTPEGARSNFHADYGDYAIRIGPSGMVYVLDTSSSNSTSRVMQLDPDTATAEVYFELKDRSGSNTIRDIDFTPDLDFMYLATEGSRIWKVALDTDFKPVGDPIEFVDVQAFQGKRFPFPCGESCKIEAIGVDICGNVYASLLIANALVRIPPDGSEVTGIFVPEEISHFAHGISWGPLGSSEFKHDAMYLGLPYYYENSPGESLPTVAEFDVGVPHRTWPGTVINR